MTAQYMTGQYDWSKLPKGWRHHKSEMYGDEHITDPSGKTYNVATWMYYEHCRDALRACRIPEPSTPPDTCPNCGMNLRYAMMHRCVKLPDTATVTALRPADEYDWSKLEGSGWSYTPGCSHISNGRFAYYFDNGELMMPRLQGGSSARTLEESREAYNTAYSLVAKCKRDWRDEVKQACEGLLGFTIEWHASPDQRAILWWEVNVPSDGLTLTAKRTYLVRCHTTNAESLLTMSLIIERLKKLGWREA